jgi:alkylation response protein AidB-like acyl-CoA dehydrogenase
MLLDLTPDQDFLRETTARFLGDRVPFEEIRGLRDDPAGFSREFWRHGAELGWTSLLVDEDLGGGSVSGNGLIDLTVIAHEFGRHAAPGPLVPSAVVAAALGAALVALPNEGHAKVLAELLSGTAIASWCTEEPLWNGSSDRISLGIVVEGDEVLLTGLKRPAESALQADHLLVTGRTGNGLTQVLVPAGTPGLAARPMQSVDLTRRFATLSFEGARLPREAVVGEVGRAGDALETQLRLALVIATAETVGALERAFEMTVEWAFDRYSFGRPLASYQELKHRFADMKSWLEASHAISDAAAAAVCAGSPDAAELVSVAKAFIGHYGTELVQDCVQIHGGIGVTFDHDLHLFLRRATLNRSLLGTPADHRQRIATIAATREAV